MKVGSMAYDKPIPKKGVVFIAGLPARTQCPQRRLKKIWKNYWHATLRLTWPKRKSSPFKFRNSREFEREVKYIEFKISINTDES